jgi:hypothetical protein
MELKKKIPITSGAMPTENRSQNSSLWTAMKPAKGMFPEVW